VKMLANQGHSARAIARMTGYSRNTVAKLLRQAAPRPFQKPPRPSKLDPFKPYLRKRAQECPLSAVRLLEEIRPMGFHGSLCILQRFLAPLRSNQRAQAKATVRFETPPGHQAQVDWAHCGGFPDSAGQRVKLYAFVMVLGFSRMLFVQFTTSMDLAQLLACHLQAFSFFGGWTRELLYDNMAQVKLPGSGEWNPLFLDFVHHYGVIPHTCRVRRPRTKGKVERMVDYLKDNFLLGRSFADLADLNAQGHHWLTHTANVRRHSTTGERPIDLLAAEKLTPLATVAPYHFAQKSVRQVSAEGFVHLARSRYESAPGVCRPDRLGGRRRAAGDCAGGRADRGGAPPRTATRLLCRGARARRRLLEVVPAVRRERRSQRSCVADALPGRSRLPTAFRL
jgi:transposase